MKFVSWVQLESFRTTTTTTYIAVNFFLDSSLEHILVKYCLHLFLVTRLKLLPENSQLGTFDMYYRPLSSFYCNTSNVGNLSSSDTEKLLNIFFSHLQVFEDDLRYLSLLKIGNRIFITKDDTLFPSNSFAFVKDRQYITVRSFLRRQQNHPFFSKYRIDGSGDTFLLMPELTESVIYHLRDLYKGLLEEFTLLTPRNEDEEWSANNVFNYLTEMYNFFNIDKESR